MTKIDPNNNILTLELPVFHKELCTSEESICDQITRNDNFAATHTNAFIIKYIEGINDIYLNSLIYEQEELEEIRILTPLEFINMKEFNTEGELLQDFFEEHDKLDPTADKIKFSKDIASAVLFVKVVVLENIIKNKRYYFWFMLFLIFKRIGLPRISRL
jgi:hypothetical protein